MCILGKWSRAQYLNWRGHPRGGKKKSETWLEDLGQEGLKNEALLSADEEL